PSASVTYNVINIESTSGTGFTVSDNFIGGQAPSCGGSAWTKSTEYDNIFSAINLNVGTGSASSVQNNTIKNFAWSNSGTATWTGINIGGGYVNVGTSTGNIIGATSGTASIIVTGGGNDTYVYGIKISGGGTVDCNVIIVNYISIVSASC
ncbi:unnamed protein product, partial [marine sediment metagenome]